MADNMQNKGLTYRIIKAAAGLFIFSFGVYMTIQASIGLAPWESFAMGVSLHTPFSYGDAALCTSITIIIIDVLMRERIGIGMILDALITGKGVDLYVWLDLVPKLNNLWTGILLMLAGMTIMAVGQWIYMAVGLGCGPRDAFLVGIGRRLAAVPIGAVQICVLAVVLLAAFLLGGPIGVGTVLGVFGMGVLMQAVFHVVHFEPRDIVHESITESIRNCRVNHLHK